MKKRFIPLLLALCGTANVSWADTPVKVTTVTTEGKFADGTHWYYLNIGANSFKIADSRNNPFITLGGERRASADNVWCFVGNQTDGYMIYNMNAGTKKALAAPKEMKGDTGGESYAYLMPTDSLSDAYTNRWDITAAPTSYGIANAFYISQHGDSNKTLNNRGRKLAFWSTGKDAGSAIAITPLYDETNVGEISIDMTTGTFTSSNTANTWHKVWTSNVADKPVITFSADNNDMSKVDSAITMAPGSMNSNTATYTIASSAAQIMRYSFTATKKTTSSTSVTLTIDGKDYDLTSGTQEISVTLPVSAASTSFKLKGGAAAEEIKITNFKVEYKANSSFSQTISLSTGTGLSTSAWASTWTSNSSSPTIKLSTTANNMKNDSNSFVIASGSAKTSTYTISSNGGNISTYTFKAALKSSSTTTDVKITANGTAHTLSSTATTISLSNINATSTTFVLSGTNEPVVLTDFTVTGQDNSSITLVVDSCEVQHDLLVTTSTPNYRIPAIAQAKNGNLIAISDYRFSGGDIGSGALDLRARISKDNGATWGEIKTIADHTQYTKGSTNATTFMHTGFGDPVVVADRESDKVLLMCCSGAVMYPSGTPTNHQAMARFYSEDGGETWQKPEDISEDVYKLFSGSQIGGCKTAFIGSGKISQSRIVKVKDYYRIYCSILMKDTNNSTSHNYVIYSDDFGKTWGVLGGPDVAPINGDCDEPKAEELPDGSVICSSRVTGGRKYNIFRFTNVEKGEGSWDSECYSNSSNNGVVATGNSCNGEVMIVPVKRNSDNKQMYLALQSVPMGPGGRRNVGIYYKELADYNDYNTPANLAKDWDGHHQASYIGSAYSTMTLQNNNTVGFLYEESTFGYDYSIIYKNYSIEKITDGKYSYDKDVNRNEFVKDGVAEKVEETIQAAENYTKTVGCYTEEGKEAIEAAKETYQENPTDENYVALNAAIANADRNESAPLKTYRIRNMARTNGTLYLSATSDQLTAATAANGGESINFCLVPGSKSGTYRIYNPSVSKYIGRTLATETKTPLTDNIDDAYDYRIDVNLGNFTAALVCTNPTNTSYPALHLAKDCTRIVPWTTTSDASRWYIEDTDLEADMYALSFTASDYGTLYMPKPFVMPDGIKGGVVTPTASGIAIDYCYNSGDEVPAGTGLLLSSTQGTIKELPLINATVQTLSDETAGVENYLHGTATKAKTSVDGDESSYTFYKLAYGTSEANSNVLGFYWGKEGGAAFTNAAYKAFLALPHTQAASAKRGFPLNGSEITGINQASTAQSETTNAIYDLQGRRLNHIPSTGVYVGSDHKKHIVVK